MQATISLRVSTFIWMHPERLTQLLAWLRDERGTIDEAAMFTGFTHPPLPLGEVRRRAGILAGVLPQFRALGLRAGINHLSTIGHLDENLANSLREPWQHLVDMSGRESASCYCAADPRMQDYIRRSYAALAGAGPDFIWVDDDVRLESHAEAIQFACFCDRCMEEFSEAERARWTRETLAAALNSGPEADCLALRRRWLEHNRDYIARILRIVREAVDAVDPALTLGLMTCETAYSGCGFGRWAEALAGPRGLPVKMRPGGGFYVDDHPLDMIRKAHSVGRQIAPLPPGVRDVQWEHENFPYQVLRKSRTAFLGEIAAGIGAGCTGVALNMMGISADPLGEYRPLLEAVRRARPFFEEAVGAFGRSPCEGLWPACTQDRFAALAPGADWRGAPAWGADLGALGELTLLGLPMAYGRAGARIALLSGDGVLQWTERELTDLLSGAVLMDGPAVARLCEMGLGDLVGFTVAGIKDRDTIERLTADALNGAFAGWHRDCRPSFWRQSAYMLEPAAPGARLLSEVIDFTPQRLGGAGGVCENRLGGRVAAFGYYPWTMLQCLAKVSQLRAVCRWLARDGLPAQVESFHRVALWCRRDGAGGPALMALNASLDPAEDVLVTLPGRVPQVEVTDMDRVRRVLKCEPADGPRSAFRVPLIGPWRAVLARCGRG